MKSKLRSRVEKQNDRNDWGDDMKNHMFLKTPAELLALTGQITFKV